MASTFVILTLGVAESKYIILDKRVQSTKVIMQSRANIPDIKFKTKLDKKKVKVTVNSDAVLRI